METLIDFLKEIGCVVLWIVILVFVLIYGYILKNIVVYLWRNYKRGRKSGKQEVSGIDLKYKEYLIFTLFVTVYIITYIF